MKLPLDGLLVADFTRVLAGPLCTQLLADAGARVVKVEEPGRGDETRHWGPPFAGDVAAYFLSINRGKESLTLDLRRGGDVMRKLVERADVVVDNFLPAQRRTLLGPIDTTTKIHCSITGYDPDSADADMPGYDLLAQAGAGLMAITGEPDGEPMKTGVALADVLTAHYAFGAICAALHGEGGARIEVSLFSATLASLVNVAQNVLVTGKDAKRYGNAHPSIVPYQIFRAKDRAFVLGSATDRQFKQLCETVIGQPELARRYATNARRVKHRAAIVRTLERIFIGMTARTWLTRCRKAGIPCTHVQGPREALAASSLVEGKSMKNPVLFDGARLPIRKPPPQLGEHTNRILRELGYDRRAIDAMREETII